MTKLAGGHDFVAAPRLSPDGSQLAWVAWDHPNMPWDDTVLYLARVQDDGTLSNVQKVQSSLTSTFTLPASTQRLFQEYVIPTRPGIDQMVFSAA